MSESGWTGRHRFFVAPEAVEGALVRFDREQSHQLARVLRVTEREPVIILTGDGAELLVDLTSIDRKSTVGMIRDRRPAARTPRLGVALYQAMLPRERFELALTKAVEVGVERFTPVRTERVVARIDERDWLARKARLEALAREAAEQSERGRLPTIGSPLTLAEAVAEACAVGPMLIARERGEESPRKAGLRGLIEHSDGRVSIMVGPEGGFTASEVAKARELGAQPIWLGPRILRSETAGTVLAAILLYESGDLGVRP